MEKPTESFGRAELLAPAGDFETALAAFAAGADAVYCGLADFSARAFAKNFSAEELRRIISVARGEDAPATGGGQGAPATGGGQGAPATGGGRRVYVTFNTLIDEDRLDVAIEELALLNEIGPDALIVQDLGVARLCRRHFPHLELHASTQLVAHNLEGVLELKELGFRRVVLARELSLEEIASIARRCGAMHIADDGRPELELECFIHGALCYSLSGLCLFGAMEKGRSGNRGACPYCCRQAVDGGAVGGGPHYPFSMRDLRLGEDARRLVEAGVTSLKIEGRMKTPLYVASVTRYYREILRGAQGEDALPTRRGAQGEDALPTRRGAQGEDALPTRRVSTADLETVFSRRTTELYLNGRPGSKGVFSPIDSESLGHLGTYVGTVKRITRDRDGLAWLRFHTIRGLEKHDGLQFDALGDDGRHIGLGIVEMRQAISRRPVFEVNAGVDVEVLLPEKDGEDCPWRALQPGMKIYCSMSNAVKRMFPTPSFRPSECPGNCAVDLSVELAGAVVHVKATSPSEAFAPVAVETAGNFAAAEHPEKTFGAVERAFAKLGGTDYRLGKIALEDPERVYVPMSVLNDLRRDLVGKLDAARTAARQAKLDEVADARSELNAPPTPAVVPHRSVKLRLGQSVPPGDWDEIVVALDTFHDETAAELEALKASNAGVPLRLALPVYTAEPDFNKMRNGVKRLLRDGFASWECADLATLRMLRQIGVADLTADWSLYAFNGEALALLAERGVTRFVASPENGRDNLQFLAESGFSVAFLVQQSTPLFISLTRPETEGCDLGGLRVFRRGSLWVTTRSAPRTFDAQGEDALPTRRGAQGEDALPTRRVATADYAPSGAPSRIDLSWDPS